MNLLRKLLDRVDAWDGVSHEWRVGQNGYNRASVYLIVFPYCWTTPAVYFQWPHRHFPMTAGTDIGPLHVGFDWVENYYRDGEGFGWRPKEGQEEAAHGEG